MDNKKIAVFIKSKRKEKGLTQEELANEIFVTEKAISRWETGRGTPDISLLIPLSKALGVSVPEILNGEGKNTDINGIIEYMEMNKRGKYNLPFKISIVCYVISMLIFLTYLRLDYSTVITINYFTKLMFIIISSAFIIIGNYIYSHNYCDKLIDKEKIKKISIFVIFIYYSVLLFNMTVFSRISSINAYNLIPFNSIYGIIGNGSIYAITINIIGNFVVFMPIQYFLIKLFNIDNFKKNLVISLLIVLTFEIIQYVFKIGVFDIDDIILCVSGMVVFYFIYNKFVKHFKTK